MTCGAVFLYWVVSVILQDVEEGGREGDEVKTEREQGVGYSKSLRKRKEL